MQETNTLGLVWMFAAIIIIPLMLTPVVLALNWRLMLNLDWGIINYFIRLFGFAPINFVNDAKWAMASLLLVETWHHTSFVVLVISAGLASLPDGPGHPVLHDDPEMPRLPADERRCRREPGLLLAAPGRAGVARGGRAGAAGRRSRCTRRQQRQEDDHGDETTKRGHSGEATGEPRT